MANKYLLAKEKWFISEMTRFFNKSKKELITLLKKQDTEKDFRNDLLWFIDEFAQWTADILKNRVKPVLAKWASTNKINPDFVINWHLKNDNAAKYLEDLFTKHSSTILKGSIWLNSYKQIIDIVNTWVSKWLSYTQVAEWIATLDPLVFSKSRSELIAIWELWKAYEYGKFLPIKDLQDKWEVVMKKWQTVEDSQVRPLHTENQQDWYIALDIPFSWTGDMIAPAKGEQWYRCRCTTIYKIL